MSAVLFLVLIATIPTGPGVKQLRQAPHRTELAWTGKYLPALPDEDDLGQSGEDVGSLSQAIMRMYRIYTLMHLHL